MRPVTAMACSCRALICLEQRDRRVDQEVEPFAEQLGEREGAAAERHRLDLECRRAAKSVRSAGAATFPVPACRTAAASPSERAALIRSGMVRIGCSAWVTTTNGNSMRLADDREVVDRMVGQRLVHRGGDGVRARNESERVAVGRGARDLRRGERAGRRRALARPRPAGRAVATGLRRRAAR